MSKSTNLLSNEELKAYSAEHLHYEISMLRQVSSVDLSGVPEPLKQFLVNILLESFAIHLRNLITFFYPTQNVKGTDVYARHFFTTPEEWEAKRPPISTTLVEARGRAHREVGHLTTYRITGTPEHKRWEVAALREEIEIICKLFTSSASKDKLDDSINILLCQDL